MSKLFKNTILSVAAIAVFAGCGGNKLDVLSYPTKIKAKVKIPDICMPKYKSAMPTVAIIDFTNNSTFGKAEISSSTFNSDKTRKSAGVAGIVASPVGVGIGVASISNTKVKANSSSTKRSVNAKLSSSITGPLESLIVNSGGAKLFTRSDMDKIDAELKFQDSGLVDPDSAAEFGKISGVRYIITGSIDNVNQKYRDNSAAAGTVGKVTSRSDNKTVQLLGSLMKLGASVTDGMVITTKLTVKMLDVQTGKIIFSKTLEESGNIGKIPNPNYDQVVGGIKKAMMDALPKLNKDFADYFAVKGYITQIKAKGDKRIVQLNIGRDLKVIENQLFKVYSFDVMEDPMSGIQSCDVIETTTKLRASQQITPKTTWVSIEEGDAKSLQLGQLVQKSHKKAGFGF
jgi:curli biogenesis system outer membrane secretion channel CsgG